MAINTSKIQDSLFGAMKKKQESKSDTVSSSVGKVDSKSVKTKSLLTSKDKDFQSSEDLGVGSSEVRKGVSSEVRKSVCARLSWLEKINNRELVKITTFIRQNQKDALDDFSRQVMRSRREKKEGVERERITANSLLRTILDHACDKLDKLSSAGIENEDELRERIQSIFVDESFLG